MPSKDSVPEYGLEYSFVNESHSNSILTKLDDLRRNATQCDIVLDVDGREFLAHKVVLMASSPYFTAMFSGQMVETFSNRVKLHEIDSRAASILLDYAYTGRMMIEQDNVQVLLPAASILQMRPVREACSRFLSSHLSPENCLGIQSFASAHSCVELENEAESFSLANFDVVVDNEEFLHTDYEQVRAFLSNDRLDVTDEAKVFEALLKWINYRPDQRTPVFGKLLQSVRLPFVNREFLLKSVWNEPLVQEDPNIHCHVIKAMCYQLDPESRHDNQVSETRRRSPPEGASYIFALAGGGSSFSTHEACEVYDPRKGEWGVLPPCIQRRSRTGVATVDRKLYLIGGHNGSRDVASVEVFAPTTNRWAEAPSMGSRRSALDVTELNELIYAVGGVDGGVFLSSAEMFDPLACRWLSVPSMEIRRRALRVVALCGSIYAIGGHDGSAHLASVERLDPREGKWCGVAPMTGRRSGAGAAVFDDKIIVAGGSDGTSCVSSTERYDPVANRWENLASMSIRRSTHELVALNDVLYALGGSDGSNSLNIVEIYNPSKNRWKMDRSQMNMKRSCFGGCVANCTNTHDWFPSSENSLSSDGDSLRSSKDSLGPSLSWRDSSPEESSSLSFRA